MKLGDIFAQVDKIKKDLKRFFVTYLIIFFIIMAVTVTISVATYRHLIDYQNSLNKQLLADEKYIHKNGNNIENIEKYFNSKGIIYKMIETGNFLENSYGDIDKIVTMLMMKYHYSNSNFFRIYISGSNPVWLQVKKGNKIAFSQTLAPGLNDYYFFLTPGGTNTYSKYSIPLDTYDFTLTTADYSRTYLLMKVDRNFYIANLKSKSINFADFIKNIK
jgi:hypothetical protein